MSDVVRTRGQAKAELAYQAVKRREKDTDYRRVAISFPILIHTCGLAQAVAYSLAQGRREDHGKVLVDLISVMGRASSGIPSAEDRDLKNLAEEVRSSPLAAYMRLSRDAIEAASWIKRYAEALIEKSNDPGL